MFAFIIVIIFSIICVINVALIFGAPLGEFTMGGKYKVLPPNMRIMAVFTLITQIFAIIIALQAGGYIPLWFSEKMTQIICFVFAAYLTLNAIMCLFSYSKKEKYVMTPLSMMAAICFWIMAFQI